MTRNTRQAKIGFGRMLSDQPQLVECGVDSEGDQGPSDVQYDGILPVTNGNKPHFKQAYFFLAYRFIKLGPRTSSHMRWEERLSCPTVGW